MSYGLKPSQKQAPLSTFLEIVAFIRTMKRNDIQVYSCFLRYDPNNQACISQFPIYGPCRVCHNVHYHSLLETQQVAPL